MRRLSWLAVVAAAFCLSATLAEAATKRHLLTESDPGGLDNAFLREYADLDALKSGMASTVRSLAANLNPIISINGLTWADDRFLMILEGDPGHGGVSLLEFWTLDDMVAGTPFDFTFLGDSIGGSGVSVGGLTYSEGKVYVVTESDPGGLGNVFLRGYNSLADLKSLTQSSATLIGTDIGGTAVSVTGLDTDGDDWYLVTESDPGGLGNVFLRTYDTLADLSTLTPKFSASLIGTNIGGTGVSTRALMSVPDPVPDPDPAPIPLPGSLPVLSAGLLAFCWLRRRA